MIETNKMNRFSRSMQTQRPLQNRITSGISVQPQRWRYTTLLLVCCVYASFCASALTAGETAEKKPASAQLVARDVNVFLVSAHGKKLNDTALFRSTTPGYMLSRRLSADASENDKPAPLGLLTFEGPAVNDIDVLIEFPSGRFLSHWPKARIQSNRIYWRSQNLLKEGPPSMPLADLDWLSHLQHADRLFVKGIDKTERFILYDVELNHAPGIELTHTKAGFELQNRETFPLKHVTILQPTAQKQGWKMASIEQVPGVKKEEKKPEVKPAAKSPRIDPLADEVLEKKAKVEKAAEKAQQLAKLGGQLREVGVLPEKAAAATAAKAKPETPAVKEVPPVSIPFNNAEPLTQENILSEWEKKLTDLGLGKPETTHVLKILGQYAFREDQATVVYCMDEGTLDKILPIEITPFPDVLRRTAVVILLDADPALLQRINQLITQLGDANWEQREAAQKKLEEYGKAAQAELQKATKNKDLEIVYRAEQILSTIK